MSIDIVYWIIEWLGTAVCVLLKWKTNLPIELYKGLKSIIQVLCFLSTVVLKSAIFCHCPFFFH